MLTIEQLVNLSGILSRNMISKVGSLYARAVAVRKA